MLKPRFEVILLIGIRLSQIKGTEYHKMYPFGHIRCTYMNAPQVSVPDASSTVVPPVTIYGQLLKNGKCIRAEIPTFN